VLRRSLALPLLLSALVAGSARADSVSYLLVQPDALAYGENALRVTHKDDPNLGSIDFRVAVLIDAFDEAGASTFGVRAFSLRHDNTRHVAGANIATIAPAAWSIAEDNIAGAGFDQFDLQSSGRGVARPEQLERTTGGQFSGISLTSPSGAPPIPLPASAWLFISALMGLIIVKRRGEAPINTGA
jgi:hypothetical protein